MLVTRTDELDGCNEHCEDDCIMGVYVAYAHDTSERDQKYEILVIFGIIRIFGLFRSIMSVGYVNTHYTVLVTPLVTSLRPR